MICAQVIQLVLPEMGDCRTPVLCTGGERLRQGLFQQGLTPVGWKLAEAVSRNWIWRTFVDNIHGSCTLDANSVSIWHTILQGIQNFGCRTLKLRWTGNGTVKERISIIHYLWAWLEPRRSKVFQKGQTAAMSQRSLPKPQIVLCPLSQNKRQQHAVWPSFSASWPEKMLRSTFKD